MVGRWCWRQLFFMIHRCNAYKPKDGSCVRGSECTHLTEPRKSQIQLTCNDGSRAALATTATPPTTSSGKYDKLIIACWSDLFEASSAAPMKHASVFCVPQPPQGVLFHSCTSCYAHCNHDVCADTCTRAASPCPPFKLPRSVFRFWRFNPSACRVKPRIYQYTHCDCTCAGTSTTTGKRLKDHFSSRMASCQNFWKSSDILPSV